MVPLTVIGAKDGDIWMVPLAPMTAIGANEKLSASDIGANGWRQ